MQWKANKYLLRCGAVVARKARGSQRVPSCRMARLTRVLSTALLWRCGDVVARTALVRGSRRVHLCRIARPHSTRIQVGVRLEALGSSLRCARGCQREIREVVKKQLISTLRHYLGVHAFYLVLTPPPVHASMTSTWPLASLRSLRSCVPLGFFL